MEQNNPNIRIQEFLQQLPANFSVLQEPVDIEVQMDYFRTSHRVRKNKKKESPLDRINELFDQIVPLSQKKTLLSVLASQPSPEAFRAIQKYASQPDPELKDWCTLALQENRMLLESSLLDEQQVFISTGLGGKGSMLRFFVVFLHQTAPLVPLQQKILHDELDFSLRHHQGELEYMEHFAGFSSAMILLPLKSNMGDLLVSLIEECNQYGGFLEKDFLVTNIKKMNESEIEEALKTRDDSPQE